MSTAVYFTAHVAIALALCWWLFVFFLAVMSLKIARDAGRLTMAGKVLGYPALCIGYVLDAAVQMTAATLLFLELPRELTVSGRVKRLSPDTGWRGKVARWVRDSLLKPFDPSGGHD